MTHNDWWRHGTDGEPIGKWTGWDITPAPTPPPRHEATGCAALAIIGLLATVCFLAGILAGMWMA